MPTIETCDYCKGKGSVSIPTRSPDVFQIVTCTLCHGLRRKIGIKELVNAVERLKKHIISLNEICIKNRQEIQALKLLASNNEFCRVTYHTT